MVSLFVVVTSQNCPWVFVFLVLVIAEVTMQYTIQLDPLVEQWIKELRMNHIDANLVIQEELDQLLPAFIKDIVPTQIRGFWKTYKAKINKKEKFVIEKLKANFRFISIKKLT